jgi:cell division protein FtsB
MKGVAFSAMSHQRISLFPIIVVVFMIIAVGKLLTDKLNRDILYLEIKVSNAEERQASLANQTAALENELSVSQTDEYIVDQARRLYGYLMPGEIRFKVSNPEALYGAEVTILEEGK